MDKTKKTCYIQWIDVNPFVEDVIILFYINLNDYRINTFKFTSKYWELKETVILPSSIKISQIFEMIDEKINKYKNLDYAIIDKLERNL